MGGDEVAEGAVDAANLASFKSVSSGSMLGGVDGIFDIVAAAIVGATDTIMVGGCGAEGDADATNRATSKPEPVSLLSPPRLPLEDIPTLEDLLSFDFLFLFLLDCFLLIIIIPLPFPPFASCRVRPNIVSPEGSQCIPVTSSSSRKRHPAIPLAVWRNMVQINDTSWCTSCFASLSLRCCVGCCWLLVSSIRLAKK